MKGWNGSLTIDGELITIEPGLRGQLVKLGRGKTRRFSIGEIRGVWFCRGRGRTVVGYIHLVTAGPQPPSNDYSACVRDPATVTFLGEAAQWLAMAERICALSGAVLEEFPAPETTDLIRRRNLWRRDDDAVGF